MRERILWDDGCYSNRCYGKWNVLPSSACLASTIDFLNVDFHVIEDDLVFIFQNYFTQLGIISKFSHCEGNMATLVTGLKQKLGPT